MSASTKRRAAATTGVFPAAGDAAHRAWNARSPHVPPEEPPVTTGGVPALPVVHDEADRTAPAVVLRRSGGLGEPAGQVPEDGAPVRAVERAGGSGSVADGSRTASCRMHQDCATSLWTALGPGAPGNPLPVLLPAGPAGRRSRHGRRPEGED